MHQPEGPIEYDPTHVVTARWMEHPPTSRLPEQVFTRGIFGVDSVPDLPWAFITVTQEGVLATAHPMWQRSLAWAHDGRGRFAVSHRLRDVVDWLPPERRGLADDFTLRWLTGTRRPGTTPFAHVHAIAPGTALRIDRAGSVTTQEWLTEDDLPAPQLRGEHAVQQYLRAFDTTVRTLINGQDILALRMSGGLDSTFVAASMVTGQRHVQAFVHSPLPGARLSVGPSWVADDWPNAQDVRDFIGPNRLTLHRICPPVDPSHPLDWAEASFKSTYAPTLNACNLRWLDESARQAGALGADAIFVGAKGNAAFSDPHRAALAAAVRGGNWAVAARIGIAELHGRPSRRRMRAVVGKVRRGLRNDQAIPGGRSVCGWVTDDADEQVRKWRGDIVALSNWGRASLLRGQPAFAGTADELPRLDPFASVAVMRAAAAIAADEWIRGPASRGFARRAAQGRLPDSVRLRTSFGAQGIDAWAHMQSAKDVYLAEAEAVRDLPLADVVDVNRLTAAVRSWPWGSDVGPSTEDVVGAERVLNLARFLRWHQSELVRGTGR